MKATQQQARKLLNAALPRLRPETPQFGVEFDWRAMTTHDCMSRKVFIREGKNLFGKYMEFYEPNDKKVYKEYPTNALGLIWNDSYPIKLADVLEALNIKKKDRFFLSDGSLIWSYPVNKKDSECVLEIECEYAKGESFDNQNPELYEFIIEVLGK